MLKPNKRITASALDFGKSISRNDVRLLLPVFVVLGGTLVLLQFVPALLLTFIARSFLGGLSLY